VLDSLCAPRIILLVITFEGDDEAALDHFFDPRYEALNTLIRVDDHDHARRQDLST